MHGECLRKSKRNCALAYLFFPLFYFVSLTLISVLFAYLSTNCFAYTQMKIIILLQYQCKCTERNFLWIIFTYLKWAWRSHILTYYWRCLLYWFFKENLENFATYLNVYFIYYIFIIMVRLTLVQRTVMIYHILKRKRRRSFLFSGKTTLISLGRVF